MFDIKEYEEKFDDSGQRIITQALKESLQRKQYYISIDHILNALSYEEPFLFYAMLNDLKLNPALVKISIENRLKSSPQFTGEGYQIGSDTSDLFKRAMKHALSDGRSKIRAGDLLTILSQIDGLFSSYVNKERSKELPDLIKEYMVESLEEEPSKSQFRVFLFLLASVIIVLILQSFLVKSIRNKSIAIDKDILHPSYSLQNPSEGVSIQPLDPVLDTIHNELQNHNFNFEGKESSNTVISLRQKQFRAKDLITDHEYPSLYCFLKEMQTKGETSNEYSTLEAWLMRIPEEPLSLSVQDHYLSYIETFYSEPIKASLESSRYARVKWLSSEGAKRIRFINTRLSLEPTVRSKKNLILLYEILFSQPKVSFANSQEIRFLYEIAYNNFDGKYKAQLKDLNVVDELNPIKNYWLGIYEFREGNFVGAQNYFRDSIVSNSKIEELSYLMQGRCIYWRQIDLMKQSTTENKDFYLFQRETHDAIEGLKKLQIKLSNSSYKEDIQAYIDKLEQSKK